MITRVLACLLVATGLAVVPVTPSLAVGPTVSVADMRFTPATLTTSLGRTVTWDFPDSMAHTTTSTQGFWDSGSKSNGGSYARTFASAGAYAYRCTFHPMMTGVVNVPVARTGSASRGWTLRWATAAGGGRTYDVQVRKGAKAWKTLKSHTASVSVAFHRTGRWSVRARTIQGSGTSGWSPAVKVTTR